ncbi:hypothetical protein SS50377_27902 [Spironucleus salmonicida]|uniref:Uncharacterized protein n=1 Tax=Spironucleus salmonicida TaxID=348837 RepID=V6LFH9_9EUKA|nr:hypothetical protein SS50377_27902 [Spironucleus salmonicida]|eukprot:EST42461.1 Hypothetical protein SS50377_17767 [Spironucleus salmonicida]
MTIYQYDIQSKNLTEFPLSTYKLDFESRNLLVVFITKKPSKFLSKKLASRSIFALKRQIQVFDSLTNPFKLVKVTSFSKAVQLSQDELLLRIDDLSIAQIAVSDATFADLVSYIHTLLNQGQMDPFCVKIDRLGFIFETQLVAPTSLQTQILVPNLLNLEHSNSANLSESFDGEGADLEALRALCLTKFQRNTYQRIVNDHVQCASTVQIGPFEVFFQPGSGVRIQVLRQGNNFGLQERQKFRISGVSGDDIYAFVQGYQAVEGDADAGNAFFERLSAFLMQNSGDRPQNTRRSMAFASNPFAEIRVGRQ